jgi:L-lactate dehydrogenase complex protein LldE
MSKPDKIYFFGTCLIDLLYPKAGLAGMELLRKAGVHVRYPKNQACCGQPAFNSGYRTEALTVARSLIKCFPEEIPIIVPSGSCASLIKNHWSELFKAQPDEAQANALANRTFELTQFLVEELQIKLSDLGNPVKIAIHTSCSARRELGVAGHIESLVEQLENVEVLQQERKAECCGFGGTFAIKQADISGAMVLDKTDSLCSSMATRVISQDCGCLMNIGNAFKKQGKNIDVQHITEFLWERTHASD